MKLKGAEPYYAKRVLELNCNHRSHDNKKACNTFALQAVRDSTNLFFAAPA